eukprot:1177531-Prorocentrum_minimum.AAC.6
MFASPNPPSTTRSHPWKTGRQSSEAIQASDPKLSNLKYRSTSALPTDRGKRAQSDKGHKARAASDMHRVASILSSHVAVT